MNFNWINLYKKWWFILTEILYSLDLFFKDQSLWQMLNPSNTCFHFGIFNLDYPNLEPIRWAPWNRWKFGFKFHLLYYHCLLHSCLFFLVWNLSVGVDKLYCYRILLILLYFVIGIIGVIVNKILYSHHMCVYPSCHRFAFIWRTDLRWFHLHFFGLVGVHAFFLLFTVGS